MCYKSLVAKLNLVKEMIGVCLFFFEHVIVALISKGKVDGRAF